MSVMASASDNVGDSCQNAHKRAVLACAAHEHAVSAEALSIVSIETRARVVSAEKSKLDAILSSCRKLQETCALTCDEAIETATLDGEDIAAPLEQLSDCRQGSIVRHMEAMNRKLEQLSRIQSFKSDKRRSITSVGMK